MVQGCRDTPVALIDGGVRDWCLSSGVGYGEPGTFTAGSKGPDENGRTQGNRRGETRRCDG